MSPHMIAIVDGRYRVYRTPNGIAREYVGPSWETPRPAHDYAAALDAATPSGLHDLAGAGALSKPRRWSPVGVAGSDRRP